MGYLQTTTYNQAGLAFDPISGIDVPGGPNPIFVPMILTTAGPPTVNPKANPLTLIPFVEPQTNQYYGGQTQFDAARELPKMNLEGTIDSPMVVSGTNYLPNILVGSVRITYPELIAMTIEGRASSGYQKVNPIWYRDPFGRVWGDYYRNGSVTRPRILAFTANYLEATPQRMQFTMTLKVL